MSRHPRMRELRAFAARETGARVSRHLAACAACRSDVHWIRDVQTAFAGPPPVQVPTDAWSAIAARIAAGDAVVLPAARSAAAPSRGMRWRVAAGILLLAASGAAYAMPGSPIRAAVDRAVARVLGAEGPSGAPPVDSTAAAPAADTSEPPPARFVVSARGGQVLVAVDGASADVRIRLRWVADGAVEVHATGAAALARFTSGPGRITVSEAAGGELLIVVPRSLARVVLTVEGAPYAVQERGSVTITAPAADTIDGEIVLTVKEGTR